MTKFLADIEDTLCVVRREKFDRISEKLDRLNDGKLNYGKSKIKQELLC